MDIRKANVSDYESVWRIFIQVIKAGDTYVFPPDTDKRDLSKYWFTPDMETYVVEDQGEIIGTYFIKPNQPGLGSHIANCGYMVSPDAQGKGIGKLLCKHSIKRSKELGFKAMQFNLVVSTNQAAIKLWEKYGFKIIGTIPNGFNHLTLGYVDFHIMYRSLN
ncbi:GNAT family N-acetyltransferase [Fulvivirga sp. M361]|uniref:GNAT family N-acetyltransferase n=1 Tax=Fulvivirga sp. M361 TaxID=2594266 RepID=UPI00117BB853|nr:GNAT family N-acetyltransferase [Fulvivirga sp. M361]TRX50460.1 GNAT family N-acetyltransferase [Fulvivirga sp. M361]